MGSTSSPGCSWDTLLLRHRLVRPREKLPPCSVRGLPQPPVNSVKPALPLVRTSGVLTRVYGRTQRFLTRYVLSAPCGLMRCHLGARRVTLREQNAVFRLLCLGRHLPASRRKICSNRVRSRTKEPASHISVSIPKHSALLVTCHGTN